MNKIFVFILTLFFMLNSFSVTVAKDCSEYNRITNWKGYSDCKKGPDKDITKEKANKFFGNLNEKYKNLRKKAPEKILKNF